MNLALVELSAGQVIGLNRSIIEQAHRWDPKCQQKHVVRDPNGVNACVGGIFQQLNPNGYVHLPLEKMAGLLLYRIAQGQFFLDGNKRTALLSTVMFLQNNAHQLKIDQGAVNDLMWGFAPPNAKYKEADAIQFIFDNIIPKLTP